MPNKIPAATNLLVHFRINGSFLDFLLIFEGFLLESSDFDEAVCLVVFRVSFGFEEAVEDPRDACFGLVFG